jgi:hypothetical protein
MIAMNVNLRHVLVYFGVSFVFLSSLLVK